MVLNICKAGRRKCDVSISPTYILTEAQKVMVEEIITKEKLKKESTTYRNIERLTKEVSAFFSAYRSCRTIATLYDFEKDICEKWNVKEFEDLGLGPLLCQDFVQQEYHPSDAIVSVTKVTFMDVVKHLKEYSYSQPRNGSKLDPAVFLSTLARKKGLLKSSDLMVTFSSSFPYQIFNAFREVNVIQKQQMENLKNQLSIDVKTELQSWEDGRNKDQTPPAPEVL
jgi:hypothetical protein